MARRPLFGEAWTVTLPTLTTPRLTLVPLTDAHLDLEFELDTDPEVLRHLYPRPRTREEIITRHRLRRESYNGLGYWVGMLDSEPVGWWLLAPSEDPDVMPGIELGYRLLRRHWRRGFASEGAAALLEYAFTTVATDRVLATTMAVNTGSRAVMERIGLQYVRTFDYPLAPGEEPLPGNDEGEVEYALTRDAWLARSPSPH